MMITIESMFLSLRLWIIIFFNVTIPALDFREAPFSGTFCEEKRCPKVKREQQEGVYILLLNEAII